MVELIQPVYKAFGLSVKSEIELPELMLVNHLPDIDIVYGNIFENLDNPAYSSLHFQVSRDKFLLKVDGVARYLIENGNKITIDRSEGGSNDEIRLYLLGSAFGALIHQRGMLPIHGSAVIFENKCVIFSGKSGAGKSTLAAGFIKKGYKLLADDVCVVTPDKEGCPIVHPGYPQMKLWNDSLEKLGHRTNPLRTVRSGVKKYALPMGIEFWNEPAKLKGIYIISTKDSDVIEIQILKGIEKFEALKNNTYRLSFLKGTGNTEAHFKLIEAVSRHCFAKHITRPSKSFYLDELIQAIELDISTSSL
jgi:hypothetical protein